MGPKKKRQTPSKFHEEASDLDETFSPVLNKTGMKESPGLKQGNLTGTARKLKDSAADLHNLIQKWNLLNVDGSNIISQIANIKLEPLNSQGDRLQTDILPESLLPLCDQISQLMEKMEKLVCRLSGMVETIEGVVQLEKYNHGNSTEVVLFQTWDVTKFKEVFHEVCEMLKKEMDLKKSIAANICHGRTRDEIMFYSAAWLHQPYIESHCELLIESVLFETRHKT